MYKWSCFLLNNVTSAFPHMKKNLWKCISLILSNMLPIMCSLRSPLPPPQKKCPVDFKRGKSEYVEGSLLKLKTLSLSIIEM